MDEEEFDALMKARPFGTKDILQWETRLRYDSRLAMTLGVALWGRTSEDVKRQLLAPHPEIPPGFELADFRELLRWATRMASAILAASRTRGLSHSAMFGGPDALSLWAARCEVVRRAIDYLELR